MNKTLKKILIIATWLCLFEIAAMLVHNSILLVGPIEIAKAWLQLFVTKEFYQICLFSLLRIFAGMVIAFIVGFLCGAISYSRPGFFEWISPILSVIKSIPVASFVVLLLIWQGAQNLSVYICFLVVFPNVCISTKNGFKAVDKKILELSQVFGLKGLKKLWYIYRPTLLPHLISCMEISIGMSFKSGVAAEVIGVPDYSIGERIYVSKVYLDTAGLAAWTLTLIVLSFLVEKAILYCFKRALQPKIIRSGQKQMLLENASPYSERINKEKIPNSEVQQENAGYLQLQEVSKAFGEKKVLENVCTAFEKGKAYVLMAPSGSGKTTLLRLIAKLERPDAGAITGNDKVSYQFQEDRLLEDELTVTNIMLTTKRDINSVCTIASEILPIDCLFKPAASLSGGMKRRVSLVRALLYLLDEPDAICLLDEPFAGLDPETKEKTIAFINKYRNGRTLIVASHDKEDCMLLGGTVWTL